MKYHISEGVAKTRRFPEIFPFMLICCRLISNYSQATLSIYFIINYSSFILFSPKIKWNKWAKAFNFQTGGANSKFQTPLVKNKIRTAPGEINSGAQNFDSENVRIRIRLVVSCQSNDFTCKPNMGTCKIHSNYIKKNGKISINPSQIIQSRHSSPSLTSTVSSPMFPIQRPTLPLSFKSKSPPSDWIDLLRCVAY